MIDKGIINSFNFISVENLSLTELENRIEFSLVPDLFVPVCNAILCDAICDCVAAVCDCVQSVCDNICDGICDSICGKVCDAIW